MNKNPLLWILSLFVLIAVACSVFTGAATPTPTLVPTPMPTPTDLPPAPVQAGEQNPDEPVFISGAIPFTSPFFLNTTAEPFVLLEDEAGFVARDHEFEFKLAGQAIGPVEFSEDEEGVLLFNLALPTVPQGTLVDLDNNGQEDTGVQVFAVAYWSNTWGGPFLERRDGVGWSTAYASTITDPDQDGEIIGGTLIVWAPDENQSFPTSFGPDGLLFTEDDPVAPIPAGYNLVDLNSEPFRIYKEAQPELELVEGEVAVKDYSDLDYADAFDSMFERVSREYPFTEEKNIDWQALYNEFAPQVADADNANDFYRALRDFTYAIPDAHVGLSFNADVFFEEEGGSFGLVLAELSDGRVIVTQVLPGTPAADEGIQAGAEILSWGGLPVAQAIDQVRSYLGPYSTPHHERLEKLVFMTRVPPDTRVDISYQNPGDSAPQEISLEAAVEYDSLFAALPGFNADELSLPVEGEVLDGSGLGYIRVNTFSEDYNLMARLWEKHIDGLIANQIPGLIIDLRINGGGSGGLAMDFAGYLLDEEIVLYDSSYYNDDSGQFEARDQPVRVRPGPLYYDGPVAVLVSPSCISACEGFAYALSQSENVIIIGNFPTAGAFGEVGQGQYSLPEDISMQFPTGRPETPTGALLIEGTGVVPTITVPVTKEGALGLRDEVLEAAEQALLDEIQ